ncbi:DUF2459 domain-containing protein [Mesorhizobium sp. M0587]
MIACVETRRDGRRRVRRRFHFLVDAGLPSDAPEVRYIVFGWGGRAFYLETPTWSQLKAHSGDEGTDPRLIGHAC